MGIDFDYEFYVHRRDSGRFLEAVAELCDPQESRWTNVLLPDGGSVRLPGSHGFVSDKTVAVANGLSESFDLSLCFPLDEPLRAYPDEMDQADVTRTWPDGSSRVLVGYIYLTISDTRALLPDHLRFGFMPAANSQSRLFLMSPSVRETFATLALSTGASLCLLDSELGPPIIVTALGQRVCTRVPGPCLLWNPRGHTAEAFEELSSWLAGQSLDLAKRIIGPQHPQFPAVVDSLAEYARVPQHLWIGP
ncbi:hypothetical protein [Lentzea sp. NPDC004782]|uniref:hypothetical protein n=1 Tax=Lentzea sp. NPDC004782 TaxID=3154458 RepID=UPI0033BAF3CB